MTAEDDHPERRPSEAHQGPSAPLARLFPFLGWFQGFSLARLRVDFLSGLTVALVLIPQSMAYAQLADLPAVYGLYAAFLPPLVAAMFGSSHQLATGPVAVVSLMTSTALAPLASAGSQAFIAYAVLLALLVGVFQFLLGVLRLGMVVNFLSHPVVNGFTNAAALIIATSQLANLLGVQVDKAEHHYETVYRTFEAAWQHPHWPTVGLGALALAIMIVLRKIRPQLPNVLAAVVVTTTLSWAIGFEHNQVVGISQIESTRVWELVADYNRTLAEIGTTMDAKVEVGTEVRAVEQEEGRHSLRAIDLHAEENRLAIRANRLAEKVGILRAGLRELRFVAIRRGGETTRFFLPSEAPPEGERLDGQWRFMVGNRALSEGELTLMGGGAVVGTIPRGLPAVAAPRLDFSVMVSLFTMAVIISLLGFMEAISIAKAMAVRTGQRLDPNQELIGQGLANIVGAFSQSYPVSGSFSRSAVNFQAGAVTGLSSAFTSLVVLVTLLFFTPLLYHLPKSVLAAIIMMAVIGLVNVSGFIHAWKAQRYDGMISVVTFVATLWFAPHLDKGIMLGVVLSLAVYLYRNMKPQMAVLSRTPDGEYRSAKRWQLDTCRHIAVLRFSSSLFFANVAYLEDVLLQTVSTMPELKHVLIVGNGINELDASGEVLLSQLVTRLRERGLDLSFSGLNEHVVDVMQRTHLLEKIGEEHLYYNVEDAVRSVHAEVCQGIAEHVCPLLHPKFEGYEIEPSLRKELEEEHPWARQDG